MGGQNQDEGAQARQERVHGDSASAPTQPVSPTPAARASGSPHWGALGILVFWLLVMGALYAAMNHYLKPKPLIVSASGDLVIPRARDGHFYADGMVNGQPVSFLVDTGASLVVVSEQFARAAGLGAGVPTVFKTANGDLQGQIVSDIPISIGPVSVSGVRIGVGLVGHEMSDALLGQSFLSKFEIFLMKEQMILRKKSPAGAT
jgi:aspartyl protease family protein